MHTMSSSFCLRCHFCFLGQYHLTRTMKRPSSVFHILIFFSQTTGPIWTKLGRDGRWAVPFQNFIRQPCPPTKTADISRHSFNKGPNGKMFKNVLLWNLFAKWDQTLMERSLRGPLIATNRKFGKKFLKIFSSKPALPIWTKLSWNGPLVVPF